MVCDNQGDDKLSDALTVAAFTSMQALVADTLLEATANLVTTKKTVLVGDIGELTLRNIKDRAGHAIVSMSDKNASRPKNELANDLITVSPDGKMEVYDSKATASNRQLKTLNEDGTPNLPKPALSKVKSGAVQLSDRYNESRVTQGLTYADPEVDDAPQSIAVKINLKSQTYQEWLVDADGKMTRPLSGAMDCSLEIAEAIAELMTDETYDRLQG
jgi:hypothetical protein